MYAVHGKHFNQNVPKILLQNFSLQICLDIFAKNDWNSHNKTKVILFDVESFH